MEKKSSIASHTTVVDGEEERWREREQGHVNKLTFPAKCRKAIKENL